MPVDFSDCAVNRFKMYAGANGAKISISCDGRQYMLKFPSKAPERRYKVEYKNSTVAEYLGCHIFNILGVRAQETLLGTYRIGEKEKVVVACEDLTARGKVIADFISVKNAVLDGAVREAGADIDATLLAIERQTLVEPRRLKTFFWDMFVADAYIGNFDRHGGNWGLLIDEKNETAEPCPAYDCGSSFFSGADSGEKKSIMTDKNDFYYHTYVIPRSALSANGKKIKYFDFLASNQYPDCTLSLLKIAGRLKKRLVEIERLVEDLDERIVPREDKIFYSFLVNSRKEHLIDKAANIILKEYPEYRDAASSGESGGL